MCGRYASSRRPEDLVEEFEVDRVDVSVPLEADYNVAPTKDLYAVFDRIPRDKRDEADAEPERRLAVLRWGLVPSWAKDVSLGSRMINARVETLSEKPAFRRAFAKRRCLLPADGYFEWYPTEQFGASGKPLKQPFFIRPADGGILAMAGLYEIWRNEAVDREHEEAFLWSACVITTTAEDSLGHIHDRMPMLVQPEGYDAWLDASVTEPSHLADVLVPAAPGRLHAYPVSAQVNQVQNNGPELIRPLPLEDSSAAQEAAGVKTTATREGAAVAEADQRALF
ncbi:MAG: SOS response-associated peptidase [Nocardioidaceae bacterium]|nr:SOS response-associated peptidase [Nocardioidaceae bacterium]